MGQAAAFLNGLVKGVDTAHRWKKDKADSDRQAKQDADADEARTKKKSFEQEIASIDPMQRAKEQHAADMAEWEAEQAKHASEGRAAQSTANTIGNFNPAAAGVPGMPKPESFQKPDAFSAPANSPVTKAVSAGIPMAQPEPTYTRPKPEIGQPSFGDALSYKQRVLEAKQKAGIDTSNDMLELTNMRKKADGEGLTQAIGLFSGGHYEDGLKAINSVGKSRWKMAPDSKPVEGFAVINGQKIPTKILKMVNQNGQERTINTANDMYSMMSLDNMFKHGQKGQELGETERHNKATEDIGRLNALAAKMKAEHEAKAGGFKAEVPSVAKAFSTPAIDKHGKPIINRMTGEVEENRNLPLEAYAYKYAQENGITMHQSIADIRSGKVKMPEQPSIPKGLVVGAPTKQPDGVYSAAGKQVTISGGKIVGIK